MIDFLFPHALLLVVPAAALLMRVRSRRRMLAVLQAGVCLLAVLVLAQPRLRQREFGTDIVVVVDRSLSMPPDAPSRTAELIGLISRARGKGDRLGLVSFGDKPQIQALPAHSGLEGAGAKPTGPHASDLEGGLATALTLIPGDRPGRVFLLTDGHYTGLSPTSAAREAAARGIPIDYRLLARPRRTDVAVEKIILPEKIDSGEPFQFSALVRSEEPVAAKYELIRGREVISRGEARLGTGSNRLVFRDLLVGRGTCRYELRMEVPDEPVPENNVGVGVTEVVNAPALLVVNGTGQEDNLTRAFRKARLPMKVVGEEAAGLSLDVLQGYRGVVLENVPASKIGRRRMSDLVQFVESLGGGLLVTGGSRSFANGGYCKSPLDPLLPVSLEVREEHRKIGIALAVVLDRSGSMRAPVGGGLTKMDLANLGTVAALEVLGANDSVSVIAVDSAAHIILPLSPCENVGVLTEAVKRIESMGGGIFVHVALVAAGKELEHARQLTRHILLFSDAADTEQPDKYRELLERFKELNITVSVIGLGNERDRDADLLKDIGARGQGNVWFTNDPLDLPRLFAQDTITTTRSTFIEEPTGLQTLPGLLMLSGSRFPDPPAAGGYNLTYLRPRATKGMTTQDEYDAPGLGFWQYGLGRVAAFTPEVDGEFTGDLARWDRYGDLLVTLGRYLLGSGDPEHIQATLSSSAGEGVLSVEIDPEHPPNDLSRPMAMVVPPASGVPASPVRVPLEWVGPTRLEARFPMNNVGTYRAAVQLGKSSVLRTNPVVLPYSPEYAPRSGRMGGAETLRLLARVTGGKELLNIEGVFETPEKSKHTRLQDLTWPLLVALLALIVLEIAERRLSVISEAARMLALVAGYVRNLPARVRGIARPTARGSSHEGPTAAAAGEGVPGGVEAAAPKQAAATPAQPEPAPAPAEDPEPKATVDQALRRVKRRRRT